jgi:hypothetical protein
MESMLIQAASPESARAMLVDPDGGATVSELANHFWEELEQRWEELEERSGGSEKEAQDSPEPAEPWAKMSSGDADSVTTD